MLEDTQDEGHSGSRKNGNQLKNRKVFAMTEGTITYNGIAINLTFTLKNHLRGKGCKVQIVNSK